MVKTPNLKEIIDRNRGPWVIKVTRRTISSLPSNTEYIGRPSKWGNRFKIGQLYQGRILKRGGAVQAFWGYTSLVS